MEPVKIVDFTKKTELISLDDGFSICSVLSKGTDNIKHVNNVSYVNVQLTNEWVKNFLKHGDKLYYMDYFGKQYENICKNISSVNGKINDTEYRTINIKKGLVLYNITKSAGHELCFIMAGIYLLRKLDLIDEYEIIVPNTIKNFGKFINSILLLFFKEDKIHFVDDKTIVNISESIIYTPPHFKVVDHNSVLLEKLKLKIDTSIYYKNVCLIKSEIDLKYRNTPHKSFAQSYLDFFVRNDFKVLSPNDYDVITLFNIINNCDNIILSWGCNAWINSIFVNKKTNVLILCHKGYSNEYNKTYNYTKNHMTLCTPVCNKLIMAFDLESKLSNDYEKTMQEYIGSLLC
jgi:hypothetical protein